jgi:lipopolysaccharide export system permease protein
MTLTFYFFRQFLPPFIFGSAIFLFVLILDKLFDLIDLIFNRGVGVLKVLSLFLMFLPTVLPLTLPMAILLACLVTFGRLSEENELTATRAGGLSLLSVLWMIPLFALLVSFTMVYFNTHVAPYSNRAFRKTYQSIVNADPLITFVPRQFFSIKNLKIVAESIDDDKKTLNDVFVFQAAQQGHIQDRIFARKGVINSDKESFQMILSHGQFQRYDPEDPTRLIHTNFGEYSLTIPINVENQFKSTRFRNISTPELKKTIKDLEAKGLPTATLEAENSLRYAIAFASLALAMVGIPLATVLRKGGKSFSFGITVVMIFFYYLLLISGLTLAEKSLLPPHLALWIGNVIFIGIGIYLFKRMLKI